MDLVNNALNRIDSWNHPNIGICKKEFFSRAANFFVTFPTETAAVVYNILLTPVYAASATLKTISKAVVYVSDSEAVKKFENKLPGFTDLLKTIANIVKYTIGAGLTATLGVISPVHNFYLHCKMDLAMSFKEAKAALEKQKELEEQALRDEEQKILNALTTAFTFAQELDNEAVEDIEATSEAIKQSIDLAISDESDKSVEGGKLTIGLEESFDDEEEYEIEYVEVYEDSLVDQALNKVVDCGKTLYNKTAETSQNAYNRVVNIFA